MRSGACALVIVKPQPPNSKLVSSSMAVCLLHDVVGHYPERLVCSSGCRQVNGAADLYVPFYHTLGQGQICNTGRACCLYTRCMKLLISVVLLTLCHPADLEVLTVTTTRRNNRHPTLTSSKCKSFSTHMLANVGVVLHSPRRI